MSIVASAALLVLAVLAYFRHLKTAWWLLVLRLLIVGLLALVLIDAVISRHWTSTPDSVAVLLDVSRSMEHGQADSAARAALGEFPFPEGTELRRRVFGSDARSVASFAGAPGPEDSGRVDRTGIAASLEQVFEERPGAILLLSDGQDNSGQDPVRAAREAEVPVYAVGCGSTGDRNVAATRIRLPLEVYAGDTTTVYGRIRYSGLGNEEVTVRFSGGFKRVTLRDEIAEQEFMFRHVFTEPGRQVARLSVDSLPGESDYADNERVVSLNVRPARLRVGYVTNRPSFGTRFIPDVLRNHPRLEPVELVALTGNLSDLAAAGERVDVYIVDNAAETQADAGFWERLAGRVKDGAGLLLLAGPGFSAGTQLDALLPDGTTGGVQEGEYPVYLTDAGRLMPWMVEATGDELPPFSGRLAPGTGSGYRAWARCGPDSVAAIVAGSSGEGRVVFVRGWPAWRWGFGARYRVGEPTPLERFLYGTVRYLAEAGREPFRLLPEQDAFLAGEPVRLRLEARAADGRAWSGLDVRLRLDTLEVEMPMTEERLGVYEAEPAVAGAGRHEARAEVRFGDSVVGRAETDFVVAERPVELARTGLNRGLLRAVAEQSGGEYFDADSLPGAGFEFRRAEYRRGFVFEPRRTPWVFAVIAVLAGLELLLRRRKGLL